MKNFIVIIFLATALCARERVKLTTYAKKYLGRYTTSGERYTGEYSAATNRMRLYLHEIRIWKNGRSVTVQVNDKFNRAKHAVPFLKLDISAKAMEKLGLNGWAWADSIEVVR